MARPEKVAVVDEVREELSENPATLLTEYRGLSVGDMAELRAALREAGARYVVVKNTLARIAARDAGYGSLEELFTGPTALTYCGDEPVRPAKALRRFAKDHPELVVKGGVLEGRVVDAETAEGLADLETREDLLQRFTQLLYGALANTASLLQAPIRDMARLVSALEEEGVNPPGEPEPEAATDEEAADDAADDDAEPASDEADDETVPPTDAADVVEEAAEAAETAETDAGAVEAAADSAAETTSDEDPDENDEAVDGDGDPDDGDDVDDEDEEDPA